MKRLSFVLPALAGFVLNCVWTISALADDTAVPATAPAVSTAAAPAAATQTAPAKAATATAAPAITTSGTAVLGTIEVQSKRLNVARDTLNPETGTSSYRFDTQAIAALPQGENTSLQNLILQAPGVAKDSFGQLHVRGDHNDLQYRINGIIVPEFISGFGDALGTRFINKVDFLTGSVPAQYGYRTAGIVNITTNSGTDLEGGAVGLYGGSHATFEPSAEYGNVAGNVEYYATGTYYQSNIGIEGPTPDANPIHDHTEQNRAFVYASDILNPDLRLGFMLGHSLGNFEIPNNPNQAPSFQVGNQTAFDSANLNETQRELNDYGIISLQGIHGQFDYQVALYTRYTSVDFKPDPIGDLMFNGVASNVYRRNIANGVQVDMSDTLNDAHTVRWGLFTDQDRTTSDNSSAVFPANPDGTQSSTTPFTVVDDNQKTGNLYGAYLQDQWQAAEALVVNYGARYDVSRGYFSDQQLSPRVNAVYAWDKDTNLHLGYSRYFTPPPLELVAPKDIAAFQGTTNQQPSNTNQNVEVEHDNYYDAGITHNFTPAFQMGLDGYYKDATHLLDEGQFGQALVFTPFNYAKGRVWGIEITSSYQAENFSSYFNVAYSRALGTQFETGQFNFVPDEIAYVATHYIHLDHDQTWSASGGVSYNLSGTRIGLDGIFGSGLRRGFANTESLPCYLQVDASATRQLADGIGVRFAIVNLLDKSYEIRDGSGIGVGAPQWGPRRGFYVGLDKTF